MSAHMSQEQKFGITEKKLENFSEWYSQVLLKGNMHDYYDIKGCYILKPQAMFIWKVIQRYFTERIEKLGVLECYFPMLVTRSALEKEKDHLEGFSPELVWITTCGEDNELENPIAVRPTSETIMYPSFSKWLRSHRDLPLRLNQWCSVLRWEVKSTLPFIRGREFLWQEGHTAFLTEEESEEEVRTILKLYEKVYSELLAVPVVPGRKSQNETFGGARYTLSVEAFIPESGKGIQAATSHSLGTNFSKIFDIQVESSLGGGEPGKSYVFQNSWGITTRAIGIAVMIHSDDRGLVLPPRVAMHQAVVIPCGIKAKTKDEEKAQLKSYIDEIVAALTQKGIRFCVDDADNNTPGYKFNYWEIQGVPIRIEVGFRDMHESKVTMVRRLDGVRKQVPLKGLQDLICDEMDKIHSTMYLGARKVLESKIIEAVTFEEAIAAINSKNMSKSRWCGSIECEESVRERSVTRDANGAVVQAGAKSLCILEDFSGDICFNCGAAAVCIALFGRSY